MSSRLPIIKQRQRDHLFQSHGAARWWIYSLFKGLWLSPLQGIVSFERKSYTLRFTRSPSEATCSLLAKPQQRQKNMTSHGTLTESTEGTGRGEMGMQDTTRRPRQWPCQRASHQMLWGLLFRVKVLRMTCGLLRSSKIEGPRLKSCLRFNDHQ